MRITPVCLMAAMAALPAVAEPVDGKAAKAALFKPAPAEAVLVPQDVLDEKEGQIAVQVAGQQPYYGAMAVAPEDGLLSDATVAATNYHDVDAAREAALEGCNARRKGAAACVIVAEIRPMGHEARPLQLSSAATEAFHGYYRKQRGAKAMAISLSTGKWAVATGEGAEAQALADCALAARAEDCLVAILDD
ncbi:5-aminolevulic acid synthase [Actibacterium sp. XHP0104]|uniref:5-aminolevulic acid synthase n=1 Tax=Actibacterium sp. XHP0104 TaxID=2984335 RepID=UPI0021E807D5|nr:5-aminolevulic acid synthase [Actibacterium sp. XHP0104]MCV2880777.1 5-aminolevulic acid synthase [Actibacterium sp. XHP0104]